MINWYNLHDLNEVVNNNAGLPAVIIKLFSQTLTTLQILKK